MDLSNYIPQFKSLKGRMLKTINEALEETTTINAQSIDVKDIGRNLNHTQYDTSLSLAKNVSPSSLPYSALNVNLPGWIFTDKLKDGVGLDLSGGVKLPSNSWLMSFPEPWTIGNSGGAMCNLVSMDNNKAKLKLHVESLLGGGLSLNAPIAIKNSWITSTNLFNVEDSSELANLKGKLVFDESSTINNSLIVDSFLKARRENLDGYPTFSVGGVSALGSMPINEDGTNLDVSGPVSILANKEELEMADRDFLNSVASLAIYTDNDKWMDYVTGKLANGETINPDELMRKDELFQTANDFDRMVSVYYAKTFMPANVMKNGEFAANIGFDGTTDFEFKNGIYRAKGNLCAASSMVSENPDGTYTLHMAYRGTDSDSRASKDVAEAEKKNPLMKNFNNIMRFADYFFKAYLDMGKHHANFEPFDKACLEFAANPENKISKIEVSGHSLGGAMVQRFLKSDELAASPFKDKVQGITWGAPQTNAKVYVKPLIVAKRLCEDFVQTCRNVAIDSYVDYICNDKLTMPNMNPLHQMAIAPLILGNVAQNVVKAVPKVAKKIANTMKGAGNYIVTHVEFLGDIADSLGGGLKEVVYGDPKKQKLAQEVKKVNDILEVDNPKTANFFRNLIDKTKELPERALDALLVIPKVARELKEKTEKYWHDVGVLTAPEKNLRQYIHYKDPVPLTTFFFATEVGKNSTLENYVDKMPVWRQLVRKDGDSLDKDILSESRVPESKEYGMIKTTWTFVKVKITNILDHLSTDKHNMRKYTMNTVMKDSMFRRTNMNEFNCRFDGYRTNDAEWLRATPQITRFEMLTQGYRLETGAILDGMAGDPLRKDRYIPLQEVGATHPIDENNPVARNMANVCKKLAELYGDEIKAVSVDYLELGDASKFANKTPETEFGTSLTMNERLDDVMRTLDDRILETEKVTCTFEVNKEAVRSFRQTSESDSGKQETLKKVNPM